MARAKWLVGGVIGMVVGGLAGWYGGRGGAARIPAHRFSPNKSESHDMSGQVGDTDLDQMMRLLDLVDTRQARVMDMASELALKLFRETVQPQPNIVEGPDRGDLEVHDPSWDRPDWDEWVDGDVPDPTDSVIQDMERPGAVGVHDLEGVWQPVGGFGDGSGVLGPRMPNLAGENL